MTIKITFPKSSVGTEQWWHNLSKGSWVKARDIHGDVVVYKPFSPLADYLSFYESGEGPFVVKFPWAAYSNPIPLPSGTKIDLQINVQ